MEPLQDDVLTGVYTKLAYQLWCKPVNDRYTVPLSFRGRSRLVQDQVDSASVLAEEFDLTYTVLPHPRNRWWKRKHQEVSVYVHGRCGELVQFVNVLDEDISGYAG